MVVDVFLVSYQSQEKESKTIFSNLYSNELHNKICCHAILHIAKEQHSYLGLLKLGLKIYHLIWYLLR